ncbi:MAG: hypothetical protein HY365_03400 [Candidatus Aenigmarchaeota archaeon]|nr:hypothetical protein [Candidatus Aenigmarchaeota archaeon]
MEISAVGDEHFVVGFNIAGVKNTFAVEKDSVNRVVEDVMNGDNAVVITNKSVYDMLNPRMKEAVDTSVKPTFVILSHDVSGEENLRMMIKRSLGIDLW